MTKTKTIVGMGGLVLGGLALRFWMGRRRADQVWATSRYPKLENPGAVERLTILPLIDWYTARDDLVGEAGVSYLIRADDTVVLFDLGYNVRREHPSPLLRNMTALNVDMAEVDAIFISHAHLDHLGGMAKQIKGTFDLSDQPTDFGGIPVYVPVPLSHPTAEIHLVDGPQVIAPGIASLGPIPRQLFFFGWTPEQSLAINVAGKGIVVVVGCGHSTLQRIVDRAEMLFDEPLYGIVGGLHYPVTGGRGAIPVQRVLGTGKWPWDPINRAELAAAIAYLARRQPKLMALSPHDSCDWSLGAFREAFGPAYQEILVGQEITVS